MSVVDDIPVAPPRAEEMGVRLHRFTVDEYHRMKEFGVFRGENPIELLHGQLIIKLDYGPPYDVPLGIPPEEITPPGWLIYPQRKFTVHEYHRLIESGALPPDLRTELAEGWVVEKMTRGARHDGTLQLVNDSLQRRLSPQWTLRQQSAVTLDDGELEPDFAIVPGPARQYLEYHPVPNDVALASEVSSTTLPYDNGLKKRDFARNSVARYWIVNLVARRIEVYEDPSGPTEAPEYRSTKRYHSGESVPLTLRDQTLEPIPVDEILPPP
jgi:hypothetical protein